MSKTGAGLARWAESIHAGGRHVYWFGTYCNRCTAAKLAEKAKSYPGHYTSKRTPTYKKHIQQGKTCTDCVGLIKGYLWEADGKIVYKRRGLPDVNASGMYEAATIKGEIAKGVPEVPGLLLWTKNRDHVAVYVGNGQEVEARGFSYGIQRNDLRKRGFVYWGLCPYVEYTTTETETARAAMKGTQAQNMPQGGQNGTQEPPNGRGGVNMPTIQEGDHGLAVKVLQRFLRARGAKLPKYGADGQCGAETMAALRAFQTSHNLTVDGVCGPLTWAALVG